MAELDAILDRLTALHPKLIDLSLGRMRRLLADLGHPEARMPPVVHIAGTNGKGSTLAMIRAGLEAGGGRVHAYTSPHLARFNERIRVAGTLISDADLTAALSEVETANAGQPITFFEVTTAAAFVAFARVPADWLLLEVGLGGRFDATNVITDPRLCVITPVSIDHTQYLGDTVGKIAFEKAGILKPGRPAVIARQQPEARAVIEARAEALLVPLSIAGQDWDCHREADALIFHDGSGLLDLPLPGLIGPHQIDNAGTALAALRALGASAEACRAAMVSVEWPARMQRLRHGPLVEVARAQGCELWLDGGHNPAAGEALAATLKAMAPTRPVHLVCGMLNSKDVAGYMHPMAQVAASLSAVAIAGEPATLTSDATSAAAQAAGLPATEAPSLDAAVAQIAARHPGARIVICGSLYLAGQVLRSNS